MNIAALLTAVWMGLTSFIGGFFYQGPSPMPSVHARATSSGQSVAEPGQLQNGVNPGGSMIPAHATSGTQQSGQPQSANANTSSNTASASASSQSDSALTLSASAGSAWETSVPLGDDDYTTSGPDKRYIYVCHIAQGGGGAQGKATWIDGSVWYPAQKVAVEGSVGWPSASYSMSLSGGERIITGNGLPTDHDTGTFPIQRSDPAYQFDANPNSVKAQTYDFTFPADPTMLTTPDCIYGEVGIMNDGVALFDGFDAEYRDAVAHETQDQWEGHPDESGVYHDHGFESGPVEEPVSTVVGFAFDGYPITGSLLPNGNYLHTADLDECHGITSTITLDDTSVTTYHYVLTQDFPYSVGCFRGRSYEPKPGGAGASQGAQSAGAAPQGQGGQAGGSPPTPPQAAISACGSKSSGTACSFATPQRTISGTCLIPPSGSQLVCIPTN